jgi:hypothetical protein
MTTVVLFFGVESSVNAFRTSELAVFEVYSRYTEDSDVSDILEQQSVLTARFVSSSASISIVCDAKSSV